MLDVLSKSYRDQYGDNFICVIPCNVYGKQDNYNLEDGHIIPSLVHRAYLAKKEGTNFIVRGSGNPLRQFIYNKDLAKLILFTLFEYDEKESIILSNDVEHSIGEIAIMIAREFNLENNLVFDKTKEDGQFKKTASTQKLTKLMNKDFHFVSIKDGLKYVIDFFKSNLDLVRK